jgi:Bacterial Ig-like domain (group 1)
MRRLSILVLVGALVLAACGGSSKSITGETGTSTTGSTTTGTGTTGTGTGTTTPTVTPASLTAMSSASSISADGTTTATITVLARNSANDLISGVTVAFSASSGGVAVTQATTDTSGSATATLSAAGDPTPRTITVTGTAGGLSTTVKVQVVSGSAAATSAVASLTTTSSVPSILSNGSTTATISALARDAANNALSGVPVTFAATSGSIAVTQATTDATGTATATLSTGGDSTARTITVTTTTASLSSTVAVPVVAAPAAPVLSMGNGTGTSFANGKISIAVPTLGAGGTTGFTLTIVDQNDNLYSAGPVTVNFSSPCIASQQAQVLALNGTTAVTSLSTSTGSLSGTYVAAGCTGSDTITATATAASQTLSATGTVSVAATSVGSIQFVSATPTTIGLKGTGLNETSTVVFKVSDSTGAPKAGVTVSFSPDTVVGGLALSPTSAVSAADGTVSTVVSSGTVHTVVRVTASITSPALSTESSQLTVTTGLPASGGFSIAVGKPAAPYPSVSACPNVEAYGIDGVVVPVTVYLADRYNNPVPDGTAVAFTTNGGHVDGACSTGVPNGPYTPPTGEGTCTVSWTSANPRPMTTDTPPVLADGRATILATAVGEESFTDNNGTGFYQAGDPFANLGEPFLSANESIAYILGDYFLDYNHNSKYDGPSGTFVGISCTGTTPGSSCTTKTLALGVSHLMIMSTSAANISLNATDTSGFTIGGTAGAPTLSIPESTAASAGPPVVNAVNNAGTIVYNVMDANGNSMAAGTTITATATIGTLAQTPATYTVGCNSDLGGVDIPATFTAPTTTGTGAVTITVTSPNGTQTIRSIQITVTP